MNVTNNLKLPQYTEEDIFDLQDINKAYDSIDNAYKEVIDFKNEIPKTNATAEVINVFLCSYVFIFINNTPYTSM